MFIPITALNSFAEGGVKLSDEIELEIEAKIDEEMKPSPPAVLAARAGLMVRMTAISSSVNPLSPSHLDLRGLKLVVDTANGAAMRLRLKYSMNWVRKWSVSVMSQTATTSMKNAVRPIRKLCKLLCCKMKPITALPWMATVTV